MHTMHILTVCDGNVCRSPMAEYLLRAELQRLGTPALHPHAPQDGDWASLAPGDAPVTYPDLASKPGNIPDTEPVTATALILGDTATPATAPAAPATTPDRTATPATAPAATTPIAVSSAGLLHLPPRIIDRTCLRLLASAGIDASDHISTVCTPDMVTDANLVLCFTRDQLAALLRDTPRALRHTFLIDDFANLCAASMRDGGPEGSTPAERLSSLLEDAPLMRPMLPSASEIIDPFRRDEAVYETTFAAIEAAARVIAQALATALATASSSSPHTCGPR